MKTCPKCGELSGDNADKCFNCFYEFDSYAETKRQRELAQMKIEKATRQKEVIYSMNDIYEYDVVSLRDTKYGSSDIASLQEILSEHGKDGWRLVNTVTNEVGHNSSSTSFGGMTVGTNATIDQMILIFERCVQRRS